MNTALLSGLCRRIVLAWLCAVIGALLQFGVFGAEPRVIINEIMYHPAEDQDDLQYIELYNSGSAAVDLSDWKLKKGVTFVFPQETKLEPGAYVVICRNRTAFATSSGVHKRSHAEAGQAQFRKILVIIRLELLA